LILSDGEFVQQLNEAGYIEEMDASDYHLDIVVTQHFGALLDGGGVVR